MASIETPPQVRDVPATDALSDDARAATRAEDRHVRRWQNRLLPFMLGAVIFMTVFFLFASLWVFYDFRLRVADTELDLAPVFASYESAYLTKSGEALPGYLRWKTLVLLEQELITRRYKQVNSVILARIWTRYLGFLTGMTLALVGAFFVLGQLRSERTTLSGKGGGAEGALATNSPGLVLATLGTVLMGISLIVTFEFDTRDLPTYVQQQNASALGAPPPFPAASDARDAGSTKVGKTPADALIEQAPSARATPPERAAPKK